MTTAAESARTVLSEEELIHLKTWWHPVDECLWAKLQDQASDLDRIEVTPEKSSLIESCRQRVNMAIWCIERRGHAHARDSSLRQRLAAWARRFRWPATEDNTWFWHLAHSVDEDLLLLLPVQEVAARALEIKSEFERNIQQPSIRRVWLDSEQDNGPLATAIQDLTEAARSPVAESARIHHARQVLRRAQHEVNEQTDYRFRQLAVNMLMRAWSGLLLFILLLPCVWILPAYLAKAAPEFSAALLLFGAAGAVLANLLSKHAFLIAMGPARRYFFYYLFAKPVEGAFAAFTFFLVLKSEILFVIGKTNAPQAPFAIQVADGSIPYVLSVFALAVGFSAERFFGTTINKVLARLSKTAEKTETSPPTAGESSQEEE